MRRTYPGATFALRLLLFCVAAKANSEVKPAALFSEHMVLQTGMPVPVWGTASPGEHVTVSIQDQKIAATAAADGHWMVRVPKLKTGGPFEMTVAGTNTLRIKDVLIGEVWLGSGQSNMAFTVSKKAAAYAGLIHEEEEIANANFPQIRMFTGKPSKAYDPLATLEGEWLVCTPENVPGFSAVGYLFARNLYKQLNLPVGILLQAFGASTAESWLPREALAASPGFAPILEKFDAAVKIYRTNPQAQADHAPPVPETINARPGSRPKLQKDPVQDQHQPTVLFNGMIKPIIPYALRGVIWYQGESIVGGNEGVKLYPRVMATLVEQWRKLWGEGDIPFYAVQLAALQNHSNNPFVREGQAEILQLKNTGLAITIDIGDPKDVHPHNKAPLGDRLSRLALANVYGRKIEYSGPVYQSMEVDGEKIRVRFTHTGGGLQPGPVANADASLRWFQVAGEDHKFVDATAIIDGDSVLVTSTAVAKPLAVRYAWDDYPDGCNLYNGAGLPASPFRTDRW